MLNNPTTEAKSETKRLFSMSWQREALPDSGSHHSFNTLLVRPTGTTLSASPELPPMLLRHLQIFHVSGVGEVLDPGYSIPEGVDSPSA